MKGIITSDKVDLKPDLFDLAQNFLNISHRIKVAKEINDKSD